MNAIPMHVIVNAGEYNERYGVNYIVAETFDDDDDDDDVSIVSLIEENEVYDIHSIPSIAKERDQEMSVSTTEDEFEDDTTIGENEDPDGMVEFFDMDCGHLSLTSESIGEPQELSYNVTDITCPMCYFTVDGGEAIVLPGCNHSVCLSCFQDHIRSSRKRSLPMCCPLNSTAACSQPIDRSLVAQIEAVELVVQDEVGTSRPSDYHPCPGLGCANIVYWKEGNGPPIGDCFQCKRTCCLKCGVFPYHSHKTCQEYQASRSINQAAQLEIALPLHVIEERGESSTRRCSL